MSHANLEYWLNHIRSVHPLNIDYSLNRIKEVAQRLALLKFSIPVITITGTNGKGSVVSCMETMLVQYGYQVGSFTSPYLETFNEQIRINGEAVQDASLIKAFATIEELRTEISLSEFEFTTLAALLIFKQANLNVLLLEVGLGGQNDAVGIVESDITIITSISLDHQEYLGDSIDAIARAEAQLLRAGKIGVIGLKKAA